MIKHLSCEVQIRVRYQETDAQGRVHHANYLTWFELGRVELLRINGLSYKSIEESGLMLVIADAQLKYYLPAEFDDLITVRTTATEAKGARIRHVYQILRGEALLVEGETVVACLGKNGRVTRVPDFLKGE